jgi:hypothetical protein
VPFPFFPTLSLLVFVLIRSPPHAPYRPHTRQVEAVESVSG